MEQLQSHIWLTASSYMGKYLRISLYIRKPFIIYDLHLLHSEFPYIWGKFYFLFYQCIGCSFTYILNKCTFILVYLTWHSFHINLFHQHTHKNEKIIYKCYVSTCTYLSPKTGRYLNYTFLLEEKNDKDLLQNIMPSIRGDFCAILHCINSKSYNDQESVSIH